MISITGTIGSKTANRLLDTAKAGLLENRRVCVSSAELSEDEMLSRLDISQQDLPQNLTVVKKETLKEVLDFARETKPDILCIDALNQFSDYNHDPSLISKYDSDEDAFVVVSSRGGHGVL